MNKWASHSLQRAADTVNLINYGLHHNENTIWHRLARSDAERFISLLTPNKKCKAFARGLVLETLALASDGLFEGESEWGKQLTKAKSNIPLFTEIKFGSDLYDFITCAESQKKYL